MSTARILAFAATTCTALPVLAQEPSHENSSYLAESAKGGPIQVAEMTSTQNLKELRPLSADRPDATESPQTVDAGHVQLEASTFEFRRDQGVDSCTAFAAHLKYGVRDSTDIELAFDSYGWTNGSGNANGFGDVTLLLKYNLWGNDSGNTALALLPSVTIPTGTELGSEKWQGGLALPFAADLGQGIELGSMPVIDVVESDDGGQELQFLHTALLGFDLTQRLGTYIEYIGVVTADHYEPYASTGFTYVIHDNLVLDIGAEIGLNDKAEDFGAFTGFTVRF